MRTGWTVEHMVSKLTAATLTIMLLIVFPEFYSWFLGYRINYLTSVVALLFFGMLTRSRQAINEVGVAKWLRGLLI